ncbi:MAG: tRNA (adenosine(37)-N6)-threonylcarbamoyltransferase complex ATPase subunit type 1 TsaE [Phycisphaeraceae bacterium]|nr:tRNA (adenosine(37)-N6)-threonylcarbamoyltransferase complex ATPase subunit type 1 TsaE [Phycisphaeraceae bacterium]
MSALLSESVEQTVAVGRAIGAMTRPGEVIALIGELGAGKTQFVRGLAEALNIDPRKVSSPTFVLVHEYEGGLAPLVHIDAYRMRSPGELEELGFEELCQGAVTAVEWADRVLEAVGEDRLQVHLDHAGDQQRRLTFKLFGAWRDRESRLASTKCPICGRDAWPLLEAYPFCSIRCRQVDLGRWLGESYRVSRPIEQSDLEQGD